MSSRIGADCGFYWDLGGSAAAAGELVKKLGGELMGYLFLLEIAPLKGREKLGGVPVVTLLEEADYPH